MGSQKPRIKPRGRIGTRAIGHGIHYTARATAPYRAKAKI